MKVASLIGPWDLVADQEPRLEAVVRNVSVHPIEADSGVGDPERRRDGSGISVLNRCPEVLQASSIQIGRSSECAEFRCPHLPP